MAQNGDKYFDFVCICIIMCENLAAIYNTGDLAGTGVHIPFVQNIWETKHLLFLWLFLYVLSLMQSSKAAKIFDARAKVLPWMLTR